MEKYTGIVIALNEKGYGFLEVAGFDKNVFFHAKDLRRITFEQIRKGDTMTVEQIDKTDKGYNAKNVFLVS